MTRSLGRFERGICLVFVAVAAGRAAFRAEDLFDEGNIAFELEMADPAGTVDRFDQMRLFFHFQSMPRKNAVARTRFSSQCSIHRVLFLFSMVKFSKMTSPIDVIPTLLK